MDDHDLADLLDAVGICPICLARIAEDGSHVTPAGAHIPAQPKEVTS